MGIGLALRVDQLTGDRVNTVNDTAVAQGKALLDADDDRVAEVNALRIGLRGACTARMRPAMQSLIARLRGNLGTFPRGPVYLGDFTALLTTQWGGMLFVDTRDSLLAPPLLLNGTWEPEVTKWLSSTLKRGSVFVDVGANIGYYSLLAAMLVGPTGGVVAVEAHPRMAQLLRRNMVANRVGVTTWHRAAWSHSEQLTFHMRAQFGANSSTGSLDEVSLGELGDTEELTEVQGIAVDDLVDQMHRIDVIKIDVEGAEARVLKGLSRTIAANPQITVMFEWSPGQMKMLDDDPAKLIDAFLELGFQFRLIEDGLAPITPSRLLQLAYGNVVASR
jgi:FkbM family methyltransferase